MGNGQAPEVLDFAALFPVCRCGRGSCEPCSTFQLTPRTAAALWYMARVCADLAHEDIASYGDRPVLDDGDPWGVFGEYPTYTWTQDSEWRRLAARAYDDLAGDLAAGRRPQQTCPAEEMALYGMLSLAPDAVAESWPGLPALLDVLPTDPQDHDWETAKEQLLLDRDLDFMFDLSVEAAIFGLSQAPPSPAGDGGALMGVENFRPSAWFTAFRGKQPRDPGRPLRR